MTRAEIKRHLSIKRSGLAVVFATLVALGSPQIALSQAQMAKATTNVNVRAERNAQSRIVTTLTKGTEVEVVDRIGDYSRVRTSDGKEGYLRTQYLELAPPPVVVAEPEPTPPPPPPPVIVAQPAPAPAPVAPAPAAAPSEATQLETIEVTGSRIKRTDYETASPIQIISREDIEKTGKANIGEVLRGVSADNQGTIPTAFTAGFAAGSSAISLRGLGVNSTLVLINGRRMVTYGLADDGSRTFVDLNSIPLEAVERIEVLKDGASALYGSDAVGGVVNIILRKSYEGASLGADLGTSQKHDGHARRYYGTLGWGNLARDGLNAFVTVEASSSDAIGNAERGEYLGTNNLTRFGWFDNRRGAPFAGGAGAFSRNNPYGELNAPPAADFNGDGVINGTDRMLTPCPEIHPDTLRCVFDVIDFEQIQPDEDRFNVMGRGVVGFGPARLYTEAALFTTEIFSLGTPSSWTFGNTYNPNNPADPLFAIVRPTLPPNHPDNPTRPVADGGTGTLQTLAVRYLSVDAGGRNQLTRNRVSRYLVGVEGEAELWANALSNYDVGVMYVESELDNTNYGFAQRDPLQRWLNDTTTPYRINNPGANTDQMYAEAYAPLNSVATASVSLIDGHIGFPIMQLPAGPLNLVFGAEARNEETDSPPVPGTDTGQVAGLGYAAFNSDRDVYAGYFEIGAPVHRMVELTGALRYDKYSDYGNSTTPKVGFKFKPIDEFVLRGTWAQAFRAPGPTEAGNSATLGFTNIAIVSIGDPSVQPETSDNFTLGFVAEPMDGTSVALDYYLIKREDEIIQADQATIIGGAPNCATPGTTIPGAQPNSFVYYADAADSAGPCAPANASIAAVSGPYANANKTETSGIDLDLKHRWDAPGIGKFTGGVIWTHLINFERELPDGTVFDYTGTHGPFVLSSAGGTPEDRAVATLTLARGLWETALNVNYVGPMDLIDHRGETFINNGDGTGQTSTGEGTYVFAAGEPVCGVYRPDGTAYNDCRLPSFTTFDLFAKLAANQQWTLTGSVRNLFDKLAPFDPYTYGGTNYHPASHQEGAVGRFFTLGLKYDFQ